MSHFQNCCQNMQKAVRFTVVLANKRNDEINEELCSEIINYGGPEKINDMDCFFCLFVLHLNNVLQYDSFADFFLHTFSMNLTVGLKLQLSLSLNQHVMRLIIISWISRPVSTCNFFVSLLYFWLVFAVGFLLSSSFYSVLIRHDYEILFRRKNWLQQLSSCGLITVYSFLSDIFCFAWDGLLYGNQILKNELWFK